MTPEPTPPTSDTFDRDRLRDLCRDVAANADAIKLMLYTLALVVATGIEGMDAEDVHPVCYEAMVRAAPKYDPAKGDAFSFFFTCGQRAGWRAAGKWSRQPKVRAVTTVSPKRIRGTSIKSNEPISTGRGRPRIQPTDTLAALDTAIRRARRAMDVLGDRERSDVDADDYRHLSSGIQFLQCLRYDIAGAYLPIRTPTMHYSTTRILPTST